MSFGAVRLAFSWPIRVTPTDIPPRKARMTLHRWFAIAVVASELAACTGADRPVPAGPSFDVTTDPVVTGSVVGPAGSICNSLSPNAVLIMRLISVARDAVAGSQNLVCPTNSYTFASVAPGSYLLRVQLPINDVVTAGFPWRVYSTTQVEVAEAPVARDLPVEPGLPLGGGVFLDGVGVPGVSLILFHADVRSLVSRRERAAPMVAGTNSSNGRRSCSRAAFAWSRRSSVTSSALACSPRRRSSRSSSRTRPARSRAISPSQTP